MHPAFSVIFLTTLIGVGQGLFLALYTGQLYSVVNVLPVQDSHSFYGIGSLLVLVFLIGGLIASFFHLGRPERAWRSAAMWRTSWLSREVIVLPAFMGMTFIYSMIHISGWNPVLFSLSDDFIVDLSLFVGAINMVLAFALFICTAMIYACLKFLRQWYSPLTVLNFFLMGCASGFTLATALAVVTGDERFAYFAGMAVFLTASALVSRYVSLLRNRNLRSPSSVQSAIGVHHPTIRQIAQGAMGGGPDMRFLGAIVRVRESDAAVDGRRHDKRLSA